VEITPMARQDRAPRDGGARSSIYDDITTRIIAELEAGRLPWVQPWGTASAKAPLALPRNAATQRQYSGINILILWGAVVQQGYPTQAWLTFRQALALGGNVRKGERGTTVVYADRFTPEDEKRRARETGDAPGQIPFLKRFTVFNAAQCEGLPEEIAVAAPPPPPGMIEPQVEALIRATGIDFRIGGDRAFYVPALDYVQVPPPQAYFEPINWHRTALHELGHATGHASRLGRDFSGSFGTKAQRRSRGARAGCASGLGPATTRPGGREPVHGSDAGAVTGQVIGLWRKDHGRGSAASSGRRTAPRPSRGRAAHKRPGPAMAAPD
jgi:antirestriction protein ArdC